MIFEEAWCFLLTEKSVKDFTLLEDRVWSGYVDGLLHENVIIQFVRGDPFQIHSKVKGNPFGK